MPSGIIIEPLLVVTPSPINKHPTSKILYKKPAALRPTYDFKNNILEGNLQLLYSPLQRCLE